MRYLLDTNTLIFAISDREQLSNDILNLLDDYSKYFIYKFYLYCGVITTISYRKNIYSV